MTGWVVTAGESEGSALVHEYNVDVIRRYFGRRDVAADVERYEREEMDHDVPVFLVVSRDGEDAGCLGMRFLADGAGELTRMFVRERFRGQGAASVLIAAMEEEAVRRGITTIRLDTRADLVEARALYAKHGYVEVKRYNEAVYSDHWFEKELAG
ncbi:GNAT family N-acetyltransferase [Nocardia sp. NRRL S-836]|uniref:GNAT family N-acetyltransferase n=1 Tax=Nocardia sp. NRRL S-836 TaxID=1519492 RepID=UPI0006AF53E6|nr:GNAT family N-acetyltransferase [Nocardia sp. NRRL S-836]KOV84959.1 hypothetical protein ADL03_11250 [Nocardia sp. NRRL S-836]